MQLAKNHTQLTINIKDNLSKGIALRESGEYEKSEDLLFFAYSNSKKLQDKKLIVESGNQLSIQYRLQAGRFARKDNIKNAKTYSLKSLDIYTELKKNGFI